MQRPWDLQVTLSITMYFIIHGKKSSINGSLFTHCEDSFIRCKMSVQPVTGEQITHGINCHVYEITLVYQLQIYYFSR